MLVIFSKDLGLCTFITSRWLDGGVWSSSDFVLSLLSSPPLSPVQRFSFRGLALDLVMRVLEEGPPPGLEQPLWGVDLLLPGIGTSLESSNMPNNNLDIQSTTTLDICGILTILWNTSSTCSPNKLATNLSVTCIEEEGGNGGIWVTFLVVENHFKID